MFLRSFNFSSFTSKVWTCSTQCNFPVSFFKMFHVVFLIIFCYNSLWAICSHYAHSTLQHHTFLYDAYTKYNSHKKCLHKLRWTFPDASVTDNNLQGLFTPWCRVLLEKLTGLQLGKKFPAFHRTRRFITTLTSVRHLSLSWASPIQSIYPHPTSWRSILILSTHLRLGLPSTILQGYGKKLNNNLYTRHRTHRRHVLNVKTAGKTGATLVKSQSKSMAWTAQPTGMYATTTASLDASWRNGYTLILLSAEACFMIGCLQKLWPWEWNWG